MTTTKMEKYLQNEENKYLMGLVSDGLRKNALHRLNGLDFILLWGQNTLHLSAYHAYQNSCTVMCRKYHPL